MRHRIIPVLVLALMAYLPLSAQEGTMIINKTDGTTLEIDMSKIASVSFKAPTITPPSTMGEAIDLGLSVKWASYNVGASSPEDYGGYYAWGETEEKSDYTESTYKYYDSKNDKYIDIGSSISGTQYDVARVKWGGSWRMPTHAEQVELYDKCTTQWTTYNGVNGRLVTGPNGNSIFLPAAGGRNDTEFERGSYGYYLSGSLFESYRAYSMGFSCVTWELGNTWRVQGVSVRPVAE